MPGKADLTSASVARVYDKLLGGTTNFAPDQETAAELARLYPRAPLVAARNRLFQIEAITWAARELGIRQWLDLGCGVPAPRQGERQINTHDVARAVHPEARAAYADIDPVAVSYWQAALKRRGHPVGVVVAEADARSPAGVLHDGTVASVITPAQPLGVIMGMLMPCFTPDGAGEVARAWVTAMAPGSCLVLSCTRNADPVLWEQTSAIWDHAGAGPVYNHTGNEVRSWFAGLDLAGPGLVTARDWHAWASGLHDVHLRAEPVSVLCGVGVKPRQAVPPQPPPA